MGRAPCCEKMGLRKGPWSNEEDQILISYIKQNGHGNWRALPKLAGLLRCGKSCRLRWINYLQPDIKRGNFTKEEDDTIIHLHQLLGNRWAAIAAKLPGRTDNEIKNVWHTHLKKRPQSYDQFKTDSPQRESNAKQVEFGSPQHSTSEFSSVTDSSAVPIIKHQHIMSQSSKFPEIDQSFWPQEFMVDYQRLMQDVKFPNINDKLQEFQEPNSGGNVDDGMDFWYNLFTGPGELQQF